MNEGFAQFHQYLNLGDCFESYKNNNSSIDLFIERDGLRCLSFYFYEEKVVPTADEINFNERVLKSVIYIKGAFILKMFADIIGFENFFKVCSNWIMKFKNKSANVQQFIDVVNDTLNNDYSEFFNTWLKNVGFPFLNVVELYDESDHIICICLSQLSQNDAIYQFNVSIVYEIDGEMKKINVFMNESEKDVLFEFD